MKHYAAVKKDVCADKEQSLGCFKWKKYGPEVSIFKGENKIHACMYI